MTQMDARITELMARLTALERERAEISAEIDTLRSLRSEEAAAIKAVPSAKVGDPIDAANDTSIALNTSTNPVQSWTVALPNGQAAIDYSSGLLGANTGTYDEISNSCLSYCGNVLNAGGVNVPLNSSLGTYRFLNSLGQ